MPNEAPQYTARLAADLCWKESGRAEVLGCFAEHLPPIDVPAFVAALAEKAAGKLRVAILGGAAFPSPVPGAIELTNDPTVANLWRNDAEANAGVRCITLVTGPVPKINSLRTAQPLVSARDVRTAAEQDAISHLNTPERIAFWSAVSSDPSVSDRRLLELASAVAAAAKGGQAVLLEREPQLLHTVGLLADPSVLATKGPSAAAATIARNRVLVDRIRRLSADDRRQVLAVTEDGGVGDALRAEARAVLAFARSGTPENLSRLTYANVLAILKAKAQQPIVQPTPKDVDEDEEPVRTPGRPRPMLGDEVALDLLLHDADDDLAGAAKAFDDAVAPGNDEDVTEEVEILGQVIARKLRSGRSALEPMLARLVTKNIWGGVIRAPAAPDLLAAVQSLEDDNARVLGFEPKKHDRVQDLIERAVKLVGLPAVLNAWEAYNNARALLLEHVYDLSDHPLMALSNNPPVRHAAEAVIKAHAAFLTAVEQTAEALRKRSSYEPAKRLLAQVLALDLVYVTSAAGVSVIAAPTHPFHLWRWLAIHDLVQNDREDLKELGETMLRELVTNPPPNGPNILMSPHVAELDVEQELVLVGEGMIAALPVFSDPQSRAVAGFRADPLATIARNLVRVAGHAKFGLRVVMIDPPSVAEGVRAMSRIPASGGVAIPIHLEVLGTKPSATASEEEQAELEELVPILYENGGSLLVHEKPVELDEITKLLANEPAHLAIIFEPGRGRTYPVDVTDPPVLSPLVLPRVYRYDAFDDRFSVVIAPDDFRFGPYYDIFEQAMSRPQDPFLGRHSGASDWQTGLEVLAKHSLWTVIIDQSLEPTFRLGDAARLDWRSAGGRDIVTFSMHIGTVEDFIAQLVEQAGLIPNSATITRTLAAMRNLGGDTIMMPTGGSAAAQVDQRIAKGLVGTLASARALQSLQPGGILVSLDDRDSRRWILGATADDKRRSDLLGVRSTPDGIVMTAVEVKTFDDADGTVSTVNGKASGPAVGQIDATIKVLARIFARDHVAPLDQARKEILQDQLYRAVASRAMSPGDRERAVGVLEQLFALGPVRIEAALCKVRIMSGTTPKLPDAPKSHMPAETVGGHPFALYEIIEGEEVEPEADLPPDSEASPPPTPMPKPPAPPPPGATTPIAAEGVEAATIEIAAAPEERVRVLLGRSADGQDVWWDPGNPEKPLMNFGILITGDPGAGKTQTLRSVIDGVARAGLPICIFDFKNDYADPAFAQLLDLSVYDVNRDGLPFNPLDLVPDEHGEVHPIRQIHEVTSILKRIFSLGDQQEARLRRAFAAAMEAQGINPRNRRKLEDLPAAPSFEDVVDILEHEDGNEALLNRLSPLFDLGLFPSSTAAQTRFEELLTAQVVIDLHSLPDDRIKAALAELMIVRLHGHLVRGRQPRALRRLLVFDEAWRVKESKRLEELAREGRAFGVAIAIGTQYPKDVPEVLSGSLETQLFLYNREADHQKAIVRALTGSNTGPAATQLIAMVSRLQKHQGFIKNQQYSPYALVTLIPHYKRVEPT